MFITINFRGTRKYEPKSFLFLPLEDIPGANDVGFPECIIVFLTIDPAKFGRQVINIVIQIRLKDSF